MAEVALSSQSVRNGRCFSLVYIKTTPSSVLDLCKKKETATSATCAMSNFYIDIRLSSIRPFAFNDVIPLSAWQFGCEPLDFERCVRKINVIDS